MSRKQFFSLSLVGVMVCILFACSSFGVFWTQDAGPLRFVQYLPGRNDEYRLLCVSHSGEMACLGGGLFSGHPTSIDFAGFGSKCIVGPFGAMNQYGAGDACFSADDQFMATSWSREAISTGKWSGELSVWSVPAKKKLWTIAIDKVAETYVRVQFSADGKVLYSAGPGFSLHRWDAQNGNYLGNLGSHKELIYAIDVSRNGEVVAAASFDGTVSLWNVKKDDAIELQVSPRSGRLGDLRFSAAGVFAVVGAGDRVRNEGHGISIWQSENASLIRKLISPEAGNIDFSADGQWMLEAGGGIWHNSYLRVWKTSSWEMVAERRFSHTSRSMKVRFLGNSNRFVVGWTNGTIELWDFLREQITEK